MFIAVILRDKMCSVITERCHSLMISEMLCYVASTAEAVADFYEVVDTGSSNDQIFSCDHGLVEFSQVLSV